MTRKTITDRDEFLAHLQEVRAQGYATTIEESLIGVYGLAAPIRDRRNEVVAAICIAGRNRSLLKRRDDVIETANAIGHDISTRAAGRAHRRRRARPANCITTPCPSTSAAPGATKTWSCTATPWCASSRPRCCRTTRRRASAATSAMRIWRKAGELGLLCADIPEEYGGGGGDFRHEAVFYEEMARRGLTGMATSVHSIVAHYLLNHGTEAQKQRYLPRMARGELVGAIAMTEPGAGSDLQGMRTRAGATATTTSSTAPRPSSPTATWPALVLVVAKTDPTQGAKGTSILIVETEGLRGLSASAACSTRSA